MGYTLKQRIKDFISSIVWPIFLWSIDETEERYWNQIYEQEKFRRDGQNERHES